MVKDKSKEELENEENQKVSAEDSSADSEEEIVTQESVKETSETTDEVQQIRLELDEYKNLYLRKAAEFENFKKRKQMEFQTLIKSAEEALMVDLLPVLDDFERFKNNTEGDYESLLQGAQLIHEKLKDILVAHGLEPIESVGTKFDPELHEALMQREEEGVESDIVLEEHQRGYRLGEKVIRHAKVIVSS